MPDHPRVRVERELCLSAGCCTQIAPDVFALDTEGLAVVLSIDEASDAELLEAESTCPAGAIRVTE